MLPPPPLSDFLTKQDAHVNRRLYLPRNMVTRVLVEPGAQLAIRDHPQKWKPSWLIGVGHVNPHDATPKRHKNPLLRSGVYSRGPSTKKPWQGAVEPTIVENGCNQMS